MKLSRRIIGAYSILRRNKWPETIYTSGLPMRKLILYDKVWSFQMRFQVKDRPRMFRVREYIKVTAVFYQRIQELRLHMLCHQVKNPNYWRKNKVPAPSFMNHSHSYFKSPGASSLELCNSCCGGHLLNDEVIQQSPMRRNEGTAFWSFYYFTQHSLQTS